MSHRGARRLANLARTMVVFRSLTRARWSGLVGLGLACGAVHCGASSNAELAARAPQRVDVAASASTSSPSAAAPAHEPKVIVFVWDGLRPDSVSVEVTPNLARLRDREGVNFNDHHSVYPTFTMMNAAALATGTYPGHHGFYGNTEYLPGAAGTNAEGKPLDFSQPVFTEDHGALLAIDAFNRAQGRAGLFATSTLFETAHAAGLRTAAIGKIGPAFMQDFRPSETLSVILDENIAAPWSFAKGLQAAGFALPANTVRYAYPNAQTLTLAANNGKPTAAASEKIVRMKDGATPDPRSSLGSAHNAANDYLMQVYLDYVLPKQDPDLSFVWLRNPDSTEHQFGPGSANYADALRDQDALLGKLQAKLAQLGLAQSTDIIVVSDHGHSSVAGDAAIFPLRTLTSEPDGHGEVGGIDAHGYAVSGELRTAELLARAGFKHVYDGSNCTLDPVLSGIRKDGSLVYPTKTDDRGHCVATPATPRAPKTKAAPAPYTFPGFHVPEGLPADAIVIAANGGSEYFYVPTHDAKVVQSLVTALQERVVYGAIFARSEYTLRGTLPLGEIRAENAASPALPDLVVSFAWNEDAAAGGSAGLPGTEYASAQRYRGMHGSFSPRDVHNTLIAAGPHFKVGFSDALPSGNVDVAPTVAALLGLNFAAADGRVLHESLRDDAHEYTLTTDEKHAESTPLRRTCSADDPSCARPGAAATYEMSLRRKVLTDEATHASYTYLDRAAALRTLVTNASK